MPHRLYGHVDAAENFSVGRWCSEIADVLAAAQREARAAIVVGGTGLYFSALTQGLAAVPPIPAQIRNEVRARLASDGVEALHAELTQRDPAAAARLMPGDRARVTRALKSCWRLDDRYCNGTKRTCRHVSMRHLPQKSFSCPIATCCCGASTPASMP